MANNVPITPGSGANVATDEVVDGVLGTVQVQYLKLMDGTNDGTNRAIITTAGSLKTEAALSVISNGLTNSRVASAASTNATSLKAGAGNLAAIALFNVASYAVFLKLYNKASAPTVGTDTPVWTIPLPASGGFCEDFMCGEYFSTGIAYAITKLQADSDTTAIAAGDVTGRIKWV